MDECKRLEHSTCECVCVCENCTGRFLVLNFYSLLSIHWKQNNLRCSPQPKVELNVLKVCMIQRFFAVCIRSNAHVFISNAFTNSNLTSFSLQPDRKTEKEISFVETSTQDNNRVLNVLNCIQAQVNETPPIIITMIMCYCFQRTHFSMNIFSLQFFFCSMLNFYLRAYV